MAVPMISAKSQAAMAISDAAAKQKADGTGEVVTTGLARFAPGDNAKLDGEVLQQECAHQV